MDTKEGSPSVMGSSEQEDYDRRVLSSKQALAGMGYSMDDAKSVSAIMHRYPDQVRRRGGSHFSGQVLGNVVHEAFKGGEANIMGDGSGGGKGGGRGGKGGMKGGGKDKDEGGGSVL